MGCPWTSEQREAQAKRIRDHWGSMSQGERGLRVAAIQGGVFARSEGVESLRRERIAEALRGQTFLESRCEAISKGKRATFSYLTFEEKEAGFRSIRKAWELKTPEERKEHGRKTHAWWHALTSEERVAFRVKMTFANLASYASGAHGSLSASMRRSWASLSSEERDERIRKIILGSQRRPTEPELDMWYWLGENKPGEWKYNGDCREGVVIGGRVPDFINVNGKKGTIEVFGSYHHDTFLFPHKETPDELIAHYARYGFKCYVFWDYEVYDDDLLKERLG